MKRLEDTANSSGYLELESVVLWCIPTLFMFPTPLLDLRSVIYIKTGYVMTPVIHFHFAF